MAPQDRASGAEANAFGRGMAKRIGREIGAQSTSQNSNEFMLEERRVTIRCARLGNNQVGAYHSVLSRVENVIAAFEQDDGRYKLYELSRDLFVTHMREMRYGSGAGKGGLVSRVVFTEHGRYICEIWL